MHEISVLSTILLMGAVPALANCDPNYAGQCVPFVSADGLDVDCSGGMGDGPVYVSGPFVVVGTDVYGLDSKTEEPDDNIACEPYPAG